MNTVKLLGLNFHICGLKDSINKIEEFIASKLPHMSFSISAELIVRASEDSKLTEIYNKTDLLTMDSYVLYYCARLMGIAVPEPVSASRIMFNFMEIAETKGYSIYLLGAEEPVVKAVTEKLKILHPKLKIAGYHNGYFDFSKDFDIINEIKSVKPDVLFVAMSSPLKELFISDNLSKLNVTACIGVGGAFDILAGKTKLAPLWISRSGFEWFYRLVQEPKRMWKRYLVTNTRFMLLFIKELFKDNAKH